LNFIHIAVGSVRNFAFGSLFVCFIDFVCLFVFWLVNCRGRIVRWRRWGDEGGDMFLFCFLVYLAQLVAVDGSSRYIIFFKVNVVAVVTVI